DREVERRSAGGATSTPTDTIELVRELAREFDDAQIARILNRQGRRTGFGNPFTQSNVLYKSAVRKLRTVPLARPHKSRALRREQLRTDVRLESRRRLFVLTSRSTIGPEPL